MKRPLRNSNLSLRICYCLTISINVLCVEQHTSSGCGIGHDRCAILVSTSYMSGLQRDIPTMQHLQKNDLNKIVNNCCQQIITQTHIKNALISA